MFDNLRAYQNQRHAESRRGTRCSPRCKAQRSVELDGFCVPGPAGQTDHLTTASLEIFSKPIARINPLQRYAAKARAAGGAPPKPVDDDFGPDVFAVAPSEAPVASAPVAEPEPARAAAAPADDDVSDDDLL